MSDLVELIHGIASGVRPSARCQVATSSGSAIVAVRWPLIASTRSGPIPATASAARMHRRTALRVGRGHAAAAAVAAAVDVPAEDLGVDARAALALADVRLSSISSPAPDEGTKPPALALIGRDASSGRSFDCRASTRMASKPAQM